MATPKAELDRNVKVLYARQPRSEDVLQVHARTHFASVLMSSRLLLNLHPPDVVESARQMQTREEAFAAAWIDAANDEAFAAEMKRLQREALCQLRTSARPMHFATWPELPGAEVDAEALGKAWNKLDELAASLGVEPLSAFVALPDEEALSWAPARRVLATVEPLLAALAPSSVKLPGKKATVAALTRVREIASALDTTGRACFEVDT